MDYLHINPYRIGVKGGVEAHLNTFINESNKDSVSNFAYVGTEPKKSDTNFQSYERLFDLRYKAKCEDIENFLNQNDEVLNNARIVRLHNLHLSNPDLVSKIIEEIKHSYKDINVLLDLHNLSRDKESIKLIKLAGNYGSIVYSQFMADKVKDLTELDTHILPYCFIYENNEVSAVRENSTIDIVQPTRFNEWKGSHLSLASIVNLLERGYQNVTFTHAAINFNKLMDRWDKSWDDLVPNLKLKVKHYYNTGHLRFEEYSYRNMFERISEADLILHPTTGKGVLGEPYSISVVQSIIQKRPLITSNSGNLNNLIKDKYSASMLIDVDELDTLQHCLEKWIVQGIPELNNNDIDYSNNLKAKAKQSLQINTNFQNNIA